MISNILLFFVSYILTLGGFLLGKSTKEELKELNKKIHNTYLILFVFSYLYLLYLSYSNLLELFFIILSFSILILSLKKKLVESFHNIFFFTLSFFILQINTKIDFFLISIFALFIFNSIQNWHFKDEVYKIITLLICFFFFSVVL